MPYVRLNRSFKTRLSGWTVASIDRRERRRLFRYQSQIRCWRSFRPLYLFDRGESDACRSSRVEMLRFNSWRVHHGCSCTISSTGQKILITAEFFEKQQAPKETAVCASPVTRSLLGNWHSVLALESRSVLPPTNRRHSISLARLQRDYRTFRLEIVTFALTDVDPTTLKPASCVRNRY